MKTIISVLFLSFSLASFTLFNAIKTIHKVDKTSTLTIEGTSNIHDWTADVTNIDGNVNFAFSDDGMINIDDCKIKIDVKSIKSTKGSTMDGKIYKALNAKNYSTISYNMSNLRSIKKTNDGFTANVIGNLTIAGTTKSIAMDIVGKELRSGGYEVSGTKTLKMTNFNIDPPKALMGALTTGDNITIKFRIILK